MTSDDIEGQIRSLSYSKFYFLFKIYSMYFGLRGEGRWNWEEVNINHMIPLE